jgi:predicted DNA-binding transcriptional regulator AlpA
MASAERRAVASDAYRWQMSRERLVRRIEIEARAYANAPRGKDQMQLGRVYGLLEAGVLEGHWRKKDAEAAANLIENRYRLSRVRDVLVRGDDVALWRSPDVAAFLGVSQQRVKELQLEGRLPKPSGMSGRTRLWERKVIVEWAYADWWGSRRWRRRANEP